MDESVNIVMNGTHINGAMEDGHLKRNSHPSPMADSNPGSPIIMTEPKRAKTSEFDEGSPTSKSTEVTQFEFNEMLSTILNVIQELDKYEIMSTIATSVVNGEKVEISIQTMQSKLKDAQYSSVLTLKDDIGRICRQAITDNSQNPEIQEHAQKLLHLASDLINDKSHYTIRSHGKKVRPREESQAVAAPGRDHEKVALFQRGPEGFVFTSAAFVKDESLDLEVSTTVVVPTPSNPNPPLLKDVNTRPRPMPPAADAAKRKSTGVEFCSYTPFTSFAPFVDSTHAELDAEDTSTAYDSLLTRVAQKSKASAAELEEQRKAKSSLDSILEFAQQYQETENTVILKEEDLNFLVEEGLDLKKLLDAANSGKADNEKLTPLEAIQKNAILLYELHKLQDERFASKDQTVSAREKEIAATLRNSLMELVSQATPSMLVTSQAIEDTMKRIPYKETAFSGTLPPNKPFAFPTNVVRNGLPPNATGFPVHNLMGNKKSAPSTFIIPQVALSPHINMTGGYPNIPQSNQHHAYAIPQQPTHQKTYSRPRASNANNTPTPVQVSSNGDVTFRKNFHTVVTSEGGTPAHWRRNDSQIPCANCGTLVSRKYMFL
ncbi:hypothetical protein BX616_010084 [Lobosporangium transversale]|nr:hypothetical protein BX616_010084 [Lobosporangium transversale]